MRAADRELRILTWEGYAGAEWLDKFKSDTGATVNIVYAGSADEMFAKMQGSQAADFDIVSFDTSLFPRYIDAKLIQPIDPAKIPNMQEHRARVRGREGGHAGRRPLWPALRLGLAAAGLRHGGLPDTRPSPGRSCGIEQYAQQMLWMDDANNSITLAALIVGAANPYQADR